MTKEANEPVENFGLYMYTPGMLPKDPVLILRRVLIERETRATVFIKPDPNGRSHDVDSWPTRRLNKRRHARFINRTPQQAIAAYVAFCDERIGKIADDIKRDSELLSHFIAVRDVAHVIRERSAQ